jgi:transposase
LDAIPGVGPTLALVASVADARAFRSGRDFSGLGWAPAEAELERRQGRAWQDRQARRSVFAQPVQGRRARVIRYAKFHGTRHRPWLTALLARRPTSVAPSPQ